MNVAGQPLLEETETEEFELHPSSKRAIGEPQLEFATRRFGRTKNRVP